MYFVLHICECSTLDLLIVIDSYIICWLYMYPFISIFFERTALLCNILKEFSNRRNAECSLPKIKSHKKPCTLGILWRFHFVFFHASILWFLVLQCRRLLFMKPLYSDFDALKKNTFFKSSYTKCVKYLL